MIIRVATAEDAAAVAALVDTMGAHDGASTNPAVAAVFAGALCEVSIRMLVAEDAGRLVGYAELQARPYMLDGVWQGWLAALVVAPGMRGRGIGAALIEAVAGAATELGCSEIVLESSDFRRDAHRFYERAGFERYRPATRFRRRVKPDQGDTGGGGPERAYLT